MKINTISLAATAAQRSDYPKLLRPSFAVIGRSNVGKSSLINALTGRQNLARTSSTPGKTRTVNFFLINELCYLIDLPGYGYAAGPAAERKVLSKRVGELLESDWDLRVILHLIDVRHEPTELDTKVAHFLRQGPFPIVWVAVKSDKLSRSQLLSHVQTIRTALKLPADQPLLPFSSKDGTGKDALWRLILAALRP